MTDVDCLDLLAQELGFVLKSEQKEALEMLLRGKDVFCVLPTALFIRCLSIAKNSSSSVQRPTVIVISPVYERGIERKHTTFTSCQSNCFLCRVDYAVEENVLTGQM